MPVHRLLWLLLLVLLLGGTAARAQTALRVHIDLRAEIAAGRFDPLRDQVGLRGATPPLSWERTLQAAPATRRPGRFTVAVSFETTPSQPLAYKFKLERQGQPDAGWEDGPNRTLRLRPGAQTLTRAFGSRTDPVPLRRSGRIHRIAPLPSAHVSPREVQVWLPPGYASSPARRYPVLYLHDGQNVFDAASAGAEWQFDEAAQRLVAAGEMAPLIIVAVASTAQRKEDYTPVPALMKGQPVGGGAAAYGRYLVEELKPLIDRRYRTEPGRGSTAVGGSSLGGLVSMWLLLEHGGTFGSGLVVSPSVWWAYEDIVAQVRRRAPGLPPPKLWLDIGLLEGEEGVAGVRRLRQALADSGWDSRYLEQPGAGHDEAAWAARVPQMLLHLHGTRAR